MIRAEPSRTGVSKKPGTDLEVPPFRMELQPPPDVSQAEPLKQPAPAPAKPLTFSPETDKEKVPSEWTLRPFNGVPYYFIPLTR